MEDSQLVEDVDFGFVEVGVAYSFSRRILWGVGTDGTFVSDV